MRRHADVCPRSYPGHGSHGGPIINERRNIVYYSTYSTDIIKKSARCRNCMRDWRRGKQGLNTQIEVVVVVVFQPTVDGRICIHNTNASPRYVHMLICIPCTGPKENRPLEKPPSTAPTTIHANHANLLIRWYDATRYA